jgi:hypothetical protein
MPHQCRRMSVRAGKFEKEPGIGCLLPLSNSAGRNTIRRAVWSRCGEVWQNIKAADVAAGR